MPGAEDAEAEHGERGEHHGQCLLDRRLAASIGGGELGEEPGADADDDSEHHHFHARGDDVAEHLLGEEGGLVEEREGDEDEAGERRQLELDQRDEELDRQDEEGDQHQQPGHHQHGDLNGVGEDGDRPDHLVRRIEQRLTASRPTWARCPGCRKVAVEIDDPPAFRPRPAKLLKMMAERLLKLVMMKAKKPI